MARKRNDAVLRSGSLYFCVCAVAARCHKALNTAKSKYETGTPPKEQTATIAEAGSDLDVTISGTAADGSAIMSDYTVPAQGGEGKIIQSPYEAVFSKRMGANEREVRYSKGGKVVLTTHSKTSADGKTLTVNVKGTDLQGKPVAAVAVYDKQ
ncbi:MAG TPA: hypothetical protein VK335_04505 [Bryobacteraceae bacterium]|nr:hypothetical protein [Bryobacteraceae bacterium]HXR16944.1 hypothetical protein [Terriglobales bacterium]HZW96295.1 hypothetical protein [Candidatus Eremiobacteraceae bacterium]